MWTRHEEWSALKRTNSSPCLLILTQQATPTVRESMRRAGLCLTTFSKAGWALLIDGVILLEKLGAI